MQVQTKQKVTYEKIDGLWFQITTAYAKNIKTEEMVPVARQRQELPEVTKEQILQGLTQQKALIDVKALEQKNEVDDTIKDIQGK